MRSLVAEASFVAYDLLQFQGEDWRKLALEAKPARMVEHGGPVAFERVGLSRPQATNIIGGRFGVSRLVVRRVLELAA